jgi:hypothetical protein
VTVLMMKAIGSSKTLVTIHKITRRHYSEEHSVN